MTDSKKPFNEKVIDLTRRLAEADWTPDKDYSNNGNLIKYVSTAKIKRITWPIITEVGLILKEDMESVEVRPPIGRKDNHVQLTSVFTLTDGKESLTYRVIAESADTSDKAVSFAHAYALRAFWLSNFPVIDGLEDLTESSVSPQDVTANLLRRAIAESGVPVESKTPSKTDASLPPTPAHTPVPSPAVENEGDIVPHGGPITSPNDCNLSSIQIRAVNRAMESLEQADREGKIMHQHLITARELRAKLSCQDDVKALLDLKKELLG